MRHDVTAHPHERLTIRSNRVRAWVELRAPGEIAAALVVELYPHHVDELRAALDDVALTAVE